MTNDRMKRLLGLLAALTCAALFAVGCGDDDGGDGGGGGGDTPTIGTTQEPTDAPDSKEEAIDRCFEEAKKLEGQARETAEASCRAAETGETDEVEEKAKEQCLESAKQIPDEAARKQAEEACEKLGD
jgi:hypothetical protein